MNLPASFDLTGKTALVTGASRGLGKHFAIELARAGVDVAITARALASLEPTIAAIRALGRRAVPLVLDVRDHASITAAVDTAHAILGRLDILINNAGCNIRKPAAAHRPILGAKFQGRIGPEPGLVGAPRGGSHPPARRADFGIVLQRQADGALQR